MRLHPLFLRLAAVLLMALALPVFAAAPVAANDPALVPQSVNTAPSAKYADSTRLFQGIPGIERAANGRLWALWYAGGPDEPSEGPGNYVVLVTSGDDGKTWSGPKLVIDPPGPVRAYDPALWHAPDGRLWLFWAQSYQWWDGRSGVWAITTENSGDEAPRWSAPRRLCNGIMMNKPTVLSTGEWLLPASVWERPADKRTDAAHRHDLGAENAANVHISRDKGATWSLLGQAKVPQRVFDEHMVVERKDGSLWMLVRAGYGIGESESADRGKTWSPGRESTMPHVNSRFFIRRLSSGKLLLVTHEPPDKKTRSHLIARLSDDDGKTWRGGLLLDERKGVSYPDGVEGADGVIRIIYDYQRTADRQILMAAFTEADVAEGKWTSAKTRQRVVVNQATGKRMPAPKPAAKAAAAKAAPVKILFDTDMMTDCDDAGAMAVLHALADNGECEILATVTSVKDVNSVATVDVINRYYGRAHLSLAMVKGAAVQQKSLFTARVASEFPNRVKIADDIPDATQVYRDVLEKQPDGSVVLVTVGYLTNLKNLLELPSEKGHASGKELIQRKVKTWVCMGGNFIGQSPKDDLKLGNVNFQRDATSAHHVIHHWPGTIVFAGREVCSVPSGLAIGESLSKTPTNNPVRRAYEHYFGGTAKNRHVADLAAVLCAVRGLGDCWELSTPGRMDLHPDMTFEWKSSADGNQRYLLKKQRDGKPNDRHVEAVLDKLLIQPPRHGPATQSSLSADWTTQAALDAKQDRTSIPYDGKTPNKLVCDTTLRQLPDGSWALFMLAGDDFEPSPKNYVGLTRSRDEGRTWTPLTPVDIGFPREGKTSGQGPTELLVRGGRSTLFFSTHSQTWGRDWQSWFMHSDDSCKTWSKPEPVPGRLGKFTFIRNHIVARDGRIIIPFQHYLGPPAGTPPPAPEEKPWHGALRHYVSNPRNGVLISSDGGKTWSEHGNVRLTVDDRYHGWAENNLAELSDGRIAMIIRADRLGGVLYYAESKDGGKTWPEFAVKTDIPNPGSKATLYPLGGDIVALLHNPNPLHRSPMALWISFDGLKTWPYRRVLVPESCDGPKGRMNYPDGFVSADKQWLHFAFDDNRHRAVHYSAKLPPLPPPASK